MAQVANLRHSFFQRPMFKETLQKIVDKTDGALGAVIMGTDGLSVEKFFSEAGTEANLDVAAAEFTSLIRTAARSANDLNLGDVRELVVTTENVTLLMRALHKEYYVFLAMRPDDNLGRGRYELRKAELILSNEFAV
jgi:predicted regulator of Ras-like GTPase activity (Roadblock/LC7/MglB family)